VKAPGFSPVNMPAIKSGFSSGRRKFCQSPESGKSHPLNHLPPQGITL
jgi:hypothetical protein